MARGHTFTLLLLDYWPLKRFQLSNVRSLILEKLPFLGMTVACAGRIPLDPCVPRAAAAESPVVIETPGGQASTALLAMASLLPRLFDAEAPLGPHYPHRATG